MPAADNVRALQYFKGCVDETITCSMLRQRRRTEGTALTYGSIIELAACKTLEIWGTGTRDVI